jgi:3-dehydroquinate synthase/2-deoxy-scyllo-inosose synthase
MQITLGEAEFPLYLGIEIIDHIIDRISDFIPDRIVLVTDSTVKRFHGEELFTQLCSLAPCLEIVEAPGESVKSMTSLARAAEAAISWGVTRRSLVVAFGGGAIGNFSGLLAALLFRGIRLAHVPTTLLAALDSVISLKQAVNAQSGKNLIGTYYAPVAVFVRLAYFQTLPEREIRSALCEVIKNAVAIRPKMLGVLQEILRPHCELRGETLEWTIRESILAKTEVLQHDGFERYSGLRFEYGHTVGHAIEHLDHLAHGESGLSHGESIGIGMVIAADVANSLGVMDDEFAMLHRRLLRQAGCRVDLPPYMLPYEVERALGNDNKRGLASESPETIWMILLREPGVAAGPKDRPLVQVPISVVRSALNRSANSAAEMKLGAVNHR